MTEKQRLTQAGWINLVLEMKTQQWHGLRRGQHGHWLGHDLLGKVRAEWIPDEDYELGLRRLQQIEESNKVSAAVLVWGDV